jgi:hypothetical protein
MKHKNRCHPSLIVPHGLVNVSVNVIMNCILFVLGNVMQNVIPKNSLVVDVKIQQIELDAIVTIRRRVDNVHAGMNVKMIS